MTNVHVDVDVHVPMPVPVPVPVHVHVHVPVINMKWTYGEYTNHCDQIRLAKEAEETANGVREIVFFMKFKIVVERCSGSMTPERKKQLKLELNEIIGKYSKNVRRSLRVFFNDTFCKESPSA